MYWQEAQDIVLNTLVHQPRLGLVTDMDGTISLIVPNPADAVVTLRIKELLNALRSHLTLIAVVSGRAVEEVRARVGLEDLIYIGSHGLQRWVDGTVEIMPEALPFVAAIQSAADDIQPYTASISGLLIENKRVSLAIHYRQTVSPEKVADDLDPVISHIANRHHLSFSRGRLVFELTPPIKIDKGTTLQQLVREYALDAVVSLGDDRTDIDSLKMAQQLRHQGECYALGIAVESKEMPPGLQDSADLLAHDVYDVERFLAWLLEQLKQKA